MALTLNPNTAQQAVIGQPLCFEGSAVMSIPQEDETYWDIPETGTNYTYDYVSGTFTKTGGGVFLDSSAITGADTYGLQPFYIQAANSSFNTPGCPTNNVHWYIGVVDDADNWYHLNVMKYCNNNCSTCGAASNPGQTWVMSVETGNGSTSNGIVYSRSVNFNESFYIRSDGINLFFEHKQGGQLLRDVVMTLPQTTTWRFSVQAGYVGNTINYLRVFKGTYQGSVPITWSAPLGGTLEGTANAQCFTAGVAGDYQVCIDSDFDEPLCVDVTVSSLTLNPVGFDCGGCVFTNEIVYFESNGGLAGTLTVVDENDDPVGTVIDALTWQAPGHPVAVTATYTLNEDSVDCALQVIPEFYITNVEGDTITGLVPGDVIKLETNYDTIGGEVFWENLNCDNLVTPDGYLTIPKNYRNACFGAVDCYIRVTVVTFPYGYECPNFDPDTGIPISLDLRIITDPVFPTPYFGGPKWVKWKPETPDFRVITKTMEGGCTETHIRNRVPTMRWMVRYAGLPYEADDTCEPSGCNEPAGFLGGYDPKYQNAKMLDDFWMLVAGQYGFFTLVDPKTGYTWKRVRFEGTMERDHINWKHVQSRDFTLVWSPCCATEPLGGVCPHSTVKTDTYPPTVPQNIAVEALSYSKLRVTWDASGDDIGVEYYELSIDNQEPIRVGTSLAYIDTGLAQTSTHSYKVRAVDYSNNPSGWSLTVFGTTFDRDTTPPSTPRRITAVGISDSEIEVSWQDSVDNVEVAGYKLLRNGYAFDVGLVTTYVDTGLDECTTYTYHVRAYDTSDNKSGWSKGKEGTTFCGNVYEGLDEILEGVDNVQED